MIVFTGGTYKFETIAGFSNDAVINQNNMVSYADVTIKYKREIYDFHLIIKFINEGDNWFIRCLQGIHPHINGETICLGEGEEPFAQLISHREFAAANNLVKDVLSTYGEGDPYFFIGNFDTRFYICSSCGSVENKVYSCKRTKQKICFKCKSAAKRAVNPKFLELCDICKEPRGRGIFNKETFEFVCTPCNRRKKDEAHSVG